MCRDMADRKVMSGEALYNSKITIVITFGKQHFLFLTFWSVSVYALCSLKFSINFLEFL